MFVISRIIKVLASVFSLGFQPQLITLASTLIILDITKTSSNRPFPSSLVPLFQNESKCKTFHMKMSSACSFILMQIKVIFIRMVSHLDSLWNWGTRELQNFLWYPLSCFSLQDLWKRFQFVLDQNFGHFMGASSVPPRGFGSEAKTPRGQLLF